MKAIETARRFVGEKEKTGNSGFNNLELQTIMSAAGHKKGEAWCAYFAEAMFVKAYPELEGVLREFFSGSCVRSFKNFRDGVKTKSGVKKAPFNITKTPVAGSLVLWQRFRDGQPTGLGHAGIVSEVVSETLFKSIEGNTNSTGSREGDSVQIKSRTTSWTQNGLNVMGFIIIQP